MNFWPVTLFMTLITIFALIGDDISNLQFTLAEDHIFDSMTLGCMVCFTLEILLSSFAKKDYFLSFFFYLDVVSTLSLITDIGFIWSQIVGTQSFNASNAT